MTDDAEETSRSCGGYRILSLLGSGGVAEVYKAIHHETEATVALKCLRLCHISNSYLTEHMIAEATLLLGLRHANVVRVTDVGVENSVLWMAMELLSGMTLRALMKASGALPVATALYYTREIADGVAAAHEMGVIHRDLKPENVMITDLNEVKVLDMGAAKFCDWDIKRTLTGTIYGTPLYMSPEHIQEGALDARADVYSLGLILYEMIAGRHPFTKENGEALGKYEVCDMQIHVTPPPLASFVKGCPGYLSELVQKAIAKDRNLRPSTMPEFAQRVRLTLQQATAQGSALPSLPEISMKPPLPEEINDAWRTAARLEHQPVAGESAREKPRGIRGDHSTKEGKARQAMPTDESDSITDNEVTQVFLRAPTPAVKGLNSLIDGPPNGPGWASASDHPPITENGTVVMRIKASPSGPAPPDGRPPRSPEVRPPSSINTDAALPVVAGALEAALRRSRLLEGALRVFLGSAIVALTLLFANSHLVSKVWLPSSRSPRPTAPETARAPEPQASRPEPPAGALSPAPAILSTSTTSPPHSIVAPPSTVTLDSVKRPPTGKGR